MRTLNDQVQKDVLLNADSESDPIYLKNILLYSITSTVTGIPTGTISLQMSNDPAFYDNVQNIPTNWIDISHSSFALTSAGSTVWNISDVGYNWIRIKYVDGSSGASTATLTSIINLKGQ
jgi:hypothetical protein